MHRFRKGGSQGADQRATRKRRWWLWVLAAGAVVAVIAMRDLISDLLSELRERLTSSR